MNRQKDGEPGRPLGSRRPADYVVVVAASDWVKDRSASTAANLWDALQADEDRHCDPEPDLEAEP